MTTYEIMEEGGTTGTVTVTDEEFEYDYTGDDKRVQDVLEEADAHESPDTGVDPVGNVTETWTDAHPKEKLERLRAMAPDGVFVVEAVNDPAASTADEKARVANAHEAPDGAVLECDEKGLFYRPD